VSVFETPLVPASFRQLDAVGHVLVTESDLEQLASALDVELPPNDPEGHVLEDLSPIWAKIYDTPEGRFVVYHDIETSQLGRSDIETWEDLLGMEGDPAKPNVALVTLDISLYSSIQEELSVDETDDVVSYWNAIKPRLPFELHVKAHCSYPNENFDSAADLRGLSARVPDGFTGVEGLVLTNRRLDEDGHPLLFAAVLRQTSAALTVRSEFVSTFTGLDFSMNALTDRAVQIASLSVVPRGNKSVRTFQSSHD
jgi:hypothetical protein